MNDLKAIRKTNLYTMFHYIGDNRPIGTKHVKDLAKKMQQEFLLPYKPLVVTNEGGVIDGQHRLEAARSLGLPIYYIETEWGDDDPRTERMIIMLNTTSRTWRQDDYLCHYAAKDGGEYQELLDFHKANSWLGISNAIAVFPEPRINAKQLKERHSFHRNPHLDRIMDFLGSDDVRGMAGGVGKQRKFVVAARRFVEEHTPSQVEKLRANIDRVTEQVSEKAYLQMFENIIGRRTPRARR